MSGRSSVLVWDGQKEDVDEVLTALLTAADHVIPRRTTVLTDEERAETKKAIVREMHVAGYLLQVGEDKPNVVDYSIEKAIDSTLADNVHVCRGVELLEEITATWDGLQEHSRAALEAVAQDGSAAPAKARETIAETWRLFALYDQMQKEFAVAGFDGEFIPAKLQEKMEQFRAFYAKALLDYQRAAAVGERERRIAQRRAERPPDKPMEGTVCSNCKKRPARVDDLCKRCAHAAGTLPHGKIT